MHGLVVLIIYVVMLAEGRDHPWYVHFLLLLNLILTTIQSLICTRVSIHPIAALAAFYIECNMLLFTLLAANRSAVSNDLMYVTLHFVVLLSPLGYVGGGVPYIFVCIANFLILTLPTLMIMAIVKTLFAAHFPQVPLICLAVWGTALRRSEVGQREQFKNKMLAETALHQTQAQHEKASELLTRMVPSFVVDELTQWVCGARDTMIADNFPMVGILFTRFPTLRNQFSDSAVDPQTVMKRLGEYVNLCDNVVEKYMDCTKLKIIGDVQLFASGLLAPVNASNDTTNNPLLERNDVNSTDSDDEPGQNHLSSLAHLAIALSTVIESHFDGAKISAGMHCGGATAGVIGNDRLIYDVFGDTVNTASRVMSTSGEGVWGSTKFCFKVSTIPHHGLFLGKCVERQMKGKGSVHVKAIAALPK